MRDCWWKSRVHVFRKHGGCRNQVLSLVLIAQNQISRSKDGMLMAFIDFRKAYDTVVREKLWGCLEVLGMKGQCLGFVQRQPFTSEDWRIFGGTLRSFSCRG